jgi:hypothetical protein
VRVLNNQQHRIWACKTFQLGEERQVSARAARFLLTSVGDELGDGATRGTALS